jgi:hypothetical protein
MLDNSMWFDLQLFGELTLPAEILARHIVYNNSAFDGNNPAADASDDAAIASDKTALLPGQTGSFANYTSYNRGINGLVIDVAGLWGTPTVDDFAFRAGNNNAPNGWTTAPTPNSITVRAGAGVDGSDRITLVWPDGAIKNSWLQVTMLPGSRTGLASPDVFYFGNAVGETGNSTAKAIVNAADEVLTRLNGRSALNPAPLDFRFDFNRDGLVDSADQVLARLHATNPLTALRLIGPPLVVEEGGGASNLASLADASLAGFVAKPFDVGGHFTPRKRRR